MDALITGDAGTVLSSICNLFNETLLKENGTLEPEQEIEFKRLCFNNRTIIGDVTTAIPGNYGIAINYVQASLVSLYAIVFILSLCGNSAMLWHIRTGLNKLNDNYQTHAFVFSLAISDIVITIICIPINVVHLCMNNWTMVDSWLDITHAVEKFTCKAVPAIECAFVVYQILTLCFIAIDRLYAITKPLKGRFGSRRRPILYCCLIFIIGVAIGIPHLTEREYISFSTSCNIVVNVTSFGRSRHCNKMSWCTIKSGSFMEVYNTCGVILLFFIPLLLMVATYSRIVHFLWIRRPVGSSTTTFPNGFRNHQRKKTVMLLISVVCVFFVCWVPVSMVFLIDTHTAVLGNYAVYVYRFLEMLALSSTAWNPVVYTLLSQSFRSKINCGALRCELCKDRIHLPQIVKVQSITTTSRLTENNTDLNMT